MAIQWLEDLRRWWWANEARVINTLQWVGLTIALLFTAALLASIFAMEVGCAAATTSLAGDEPAIVRADELTAALLAVETFQNENVLLRATIGELQIGSGDGNFIGGILAVGMVACLFMRRPQDTRPWQAARNWLARAPPPVK